MDLAIHELSLGSGQPFSGTIEAGRSLCIVGPTRSGKTKVLRTLAGLEEPSQGGVSLQHPAAVPQPCNRRLRPQDLSHRKGENRAMVSTEVLTNLGLWENRGQVIANLSPAQIAACDLVETFVSGQSLIGLDGHLDLLDPWARAGAFRLIADRCRHGAIVLVATNHLDMASQFDWILVMKERQALYFGEVWDLVGTRGQRSLIIESERHKGVRALVDPLLVGVTRTDSGYELHPGPGQELTAKLLREGYGDVKYMVSDERSLPEIILGLIE